MVTERSQSSTVDSRAFSAAAPLAARFSTPVMCCYSCTECNKNVYTLTDHWAHNRVGGGGGEIDI